MPNEWRLDRAQRKGVRVHLSGIKPSGEPVGIVHHFASDGKLKRLATGCPAVELTVICSAYCAGCFLFGSASSLTLPPGSVVGPEFTSTKNCCPVEG